MKAILDGCQITCIIRYGKNGKKYVWDNPTQEKLDQLVKKYGYEQICDNICWLWR